MPHKIWVLFTVVSFVVFNGLALSEAWQASEEHFSRTNATRIFSSPIAMAPKCWKLSYLGVPLGEYRSSMERDVVELRQKVSLKVEASGLKGPLSTLAGAGSIQATGDVVYDLLQNFSYADIDWKAGTMEGRIFLRRQGSVIQVSVLTPDGQATRQIPWNPDEMPGADLFSSLSVPGLQKGESWSLPMVHPLTGEREALRARATSFDTPADAWNVDILRSGTVVATAQIRPSGELEGLECLGFSARIQREEAP
ncbi:MAG: hypothetical protein AB7F75_12070 [Planctomycetota bacterium]